MTPGLARDILRQYFRVLKKDSDIEKPQPVVEAEEMLGEEVTQEIREMVENEQDS